MDKALIFELIAGGWATATLILFIGFLNVIRGEVSSIRGDVMMRLDRIDGHIAKLEDRVYHLASSKEKK